MNVKTLILKYLREGLSAGETAELDGWLAISAENRELFREMNDPDLVATNLEILDRVHEEEALLRFKNYTELQKTSDTSTPIINRVYKLRFIRRWWWAAAILLVVAGGYLIIQNKKSLPQSPEIVKQDVKAPAKNNAVVTLSNGKQIVLDSAGNGALAQQGNALIVKTGNGQLSYQPTASGQGINVIQYNTLTNPRGSKVISLILADGTKVWLNAESSLRYPTVFAGKERKVEINGEAYFEVAHNAAMPFVVAKDKMAVNVLGTHFNVNAYDDEPGIKVTLLEGSVKVALGPEPGEGGNIPKSQILKPGQQAQIDTGKININYFPDIEKIMAWKNNEFNFKDDDIKTIMRQLARWYDINPVFEGETGAHHYVGQLSMDVPISEILRTFEMLNYVRFEINNKTVKVIPVGK